MKKPIVVATLAMGVLMAFSLTNIIRSGLAQRDLLSLGLQALLMVGLLKGHRLVWQWGRVLAVLSLVPIAGMVFAASKSAIGIVPVIPVIALAGLPAVVIFFAFGTVAAKEHFRLICPACSSKEVRANDFLFTSAKCKACSHQW
jgi:hypothetical protein